MKLLRNLWEMLKALEEYEPRFQTPLLSKLSDLSTTAFLTFVNLIS